MPIQPPDQELNPASLAAAAYDLWQEQWQLLRTDPALVQDLQNFMEQFGQTMAAALAAAAPMPAPKGATDAAANRRAAGTGTAPTSQSGAKPVGAASGAQQPDLAELAAAVATLTAKVADLEARLATTKLVAEPAATRRKTGRGKRQTPA